MIKKFGKSFKLLSQHLIKKQENLLNLNLFQQALSCLPSQEKGFYLQENQGWEYSLISAWRSSNHGKNLFGIPHSTIRYWDLRYFFDKRSYNAGVSDCSLPLPDYIGVNGIRAKEMYTEFEFHQIRKVIENRSKSINNFKLEYFEIMNLAEFSNISKKNLKKFLVLSSENPESQNLVFKARQLLGKL